MLPLLWLTEMVEEEDRDVVPNERLPVRVAFERSSDLLLRTFRGGVTLRVAVFIFITGLLSVRFGDIFYFFMLDVIHFSK